MPTWTSRLRRFLFHHLKNHNLYKYLRLQENSELNNLPVTRINGSRKAGILSRVFSEDYGVEQVKRQCVLDPRGRGSLWWSRVFLAACLVSLVVDPLFLLLPEVSPQVCVGTNLSLEIVLTVLRSMVDLFYLINIFVTFRTAYIAPSSRVPGRGELVLDSWKIAMEYISKQFWIDLITVLPIPQVLIWVVLPNVRNPAISNTKTSLRFIILLQYLQRVFMAYPLSKKIAKATGIVTTTAWVGAAYNFMFYLLGSHVVGTIWYLLAVEREEACWKSVCDQYFNSSSCRYSFFDCGKTGNGSRNEWIRSSNILNLCNPSSSYYQWGIYNAAVSYGITSGHFFNKFFYCLWFGLRNLSSTGQNLSTTIDIGENIFASLVTITGLTFLALLIGNMQMYIQSTTARLEEWRLKRADTEQWMHHRQIPQDLRQCIRKYDMYKWVATQGVDEEAILKDLPTDLRRQIKRHLCLNLVRRVPLFDQMDDRLLDSICERLKPILCTKGTVLLREGDPVSEMLFIVRGQLLSSTVDGGQAGFCNSYRIGAGDFCSDELLTWATAQRRPRPDVALPLSTRIVEAVSDVEAFVLAAEDLKFMVAQFRRLRSKQLSHKLRVYSHQWRTWAACIIQSAWRRYKRRREAVEEHVQALPC
ncbi:hypothetical protein NMG60_11015692 [Bertholletia excelsa]